MTKRAKASNAPDLYNAFHKQDSQIGPWLNARSRDEDADILQALDAALDIPVVVFERVFARYYCLFLLAEADTYDEQFWYAVTRMLGWEYEQHHGGSAKFLVESATTAAEANATGVLEGTAFYGPSDPATATATRRKTNYETKRKDPRSLRRDLKQIPMTSLGQVSTFCESCQEVEHHNRWKAITGLNAGIQMPFGKKSTLGKVGKRTLIQVCRRCELITEVDD